MKVKKTNIILIVIISAYSCQSNSQWVQIAALPVNKISAVKFFNENVGFACGGGVWKTTNGGYNWTQIFTAEANSFHFLDTLNGFVSGNPARIYKTTNGGTNWSEYILTSGFTGVQAIGFFNSVIGVSAGFHIINRTSNSGASWIRQDSIYFQEQLSISISTNGYAWIAGGAPFELVKRTSDYGVTWAQQSGGFGTGGLNGVYAINQNTVYVCGHYGRIRRTTNGGTNWIKLDSLTNRSLKAVHFANVSTGAVVGDIGIILRTTNSGNNWLFQTSGTGNHLYSIQYLNDQTGWIGGNNGILLKTTNGGITPVVNISGNTPKDYVLFQNYPNPFNPETNIRFSIKNTGHTSVIIYNTEGKEIQKIVNQNVNSGTYEVKWNAGSYPSGVYFYSLFSRDYRITKKMILIK